MLFFYLDAIAITVHAETMCLLYSSAICARVITFQFLRPPSLSKVCHFYLRAICEQKDELILRPPIVQALNYMQQDLAVAKKLGDIAGECRAHGNLGSAYFSKGNYKVF
jgi:hypothetical protein